MARVPTYLENGTTPVSVDMRAPLAEARRLAAADPLLKGTALTFLRGFGSYRQNAASGGTDTGSGHADFNAEGMTDAQAQRWVLYLRRVGVMAYFRPRSWYSWWTKAIRKPGWQRHIHCILVGSTDMSSAATAQVKEWVAGGDALVGPEADNGDRTVVGRTWAAYLELAKAVSSIGQSVGDAARVKAIQKALHITADGVWGKQTDSALYWLWNIRKGGLTQFKRYNVTNRKAMQTQWGARPVDGIWGPLTQAANRATVVKVQKALGVTADGVWGPVTARAYYALRGRAFE